MSTRRLFCSCLFSLSLSLAAQAHAKEVVLPLPTNTKVKSSDCSSLLLPWFTRTKTFLAIRASNFADLERFNGLDVTIVPLSDSPVFTSQWVLVDEGEFLAERTYWKKQNYYAGFPQRFSDDNNIVYTGYLLPWNSERKGKLLVNVPNKSLYLQDRDGRTFSYQNYFDTPDSLLLVSTRSLNLGN